ncbi:MAG: SDR family NAD(P)-dependent oxidoreductase, partial [Jeotgalicoccus sp.]|nr:SDR family NAD(P)-dependent oxidoreductase [Jeotgalicoccus sp.]
MANRFEDKVILMTGAASGLGQDAAVRVASEGAKLVLVDLNEEALKETEELIKKENSNAEVLSIKADVSNEDEVKNYVDKTVQTFGKIDGFFNNAGIEGKQNL